ncbi:MAG: 4Fe-4S binding protein [Chloroflexota bacterium]
MEQAEDLDLTPPSARTGDHLVLEDSLVIIGVPVYGGRVPPEAARRLRRLKGNGTPAALVAVYGNRAYEDALLELRNLASEGGFVPFAGGVFIGEHSLDSPETPLATGRPDQKDLVKAGAFGDDIREYLGKIKSTAGIIPLEVPGNIPYRQHTERVITSPVTNEELCVKCGTCAAVCPAGAITVGDTVVTSADDCILCRACVKSCPESAREIVDPRITERAVRLSKNFRSPRKEPETYLSHRK